MSVTFTTLQSRLLSDTHNISVLQGYNSTPISKAIYKIDYDNSSSPVYWDGSYSITTDEPIILADAYPEQTTIYDLPMYKLSILDWNIYPRTAGVNISRVPMGYITTSPELVLTFNANSPSRDLIKTVNGKIRLSSSSDLTDSTVVPDYVWSTQIKPSQAITGNIIFGVEYYGKATFGDAENTFPTITSATYDGLVFTVNLSTDCNWLGGNFILHDGLGNYWTYDGSPNVAENTNKFIFEAFTPIEAGTIDVSAGWFHFPSGSFEDLQTGVRNVMTHMLYEPL